MFVLSPLREFSFIFRCEVCSAAGGHIKKLEILPRLHFERAKSAERLDETRKLQSDAILKIQHSGGTGTSSCFRYVAYGQKLLGLFKPVVCTIEQVASNIHVHVISFTNFNFIVVFLSC